MVQICPLCKSTNIDVLFGSGKRSKCIDCGYQGIYFIEMDLEKAGGFLRNK